jgi:serine/threonine protein kinase
MSSAKYFYFSKETSIINRTQHSTILKCKDKDGVTFVKKVYKNDIYAINEHLFYDMISHKNIIKYFGKRLSNDKFELLFEYSHLGSLFDNLSALSITDKKKIIQELCQALIYLHERGIVHNDIKLENILLFKDDNGIYPKLCDFGISYLHSDTEPPAEPADPFCINYTHNVVSIVNTNNNFLFEKRGYATDYFNLGELVFKLFLKEELYTNSDKTDYINNKLYKNKDCWVKCRDEQMMNFIEAMLELNQCERLNDKTVLQHEFIKSM